jgi:hypothetical protein
LIYIDEYARLTIPEEDMSFEIEDEHAIPAARQHSGRREKYPWSQLDVGQSFFVKDARLRSMTSTASHAGRRNGKKFIARAADGGVRVWRYE